MPFRTLRSSARATPRGLFGKSGSMIDHSKSDNSYRRGVMAGSLTELESPFAAKRNLEGYVRSPARAFDRYEGRPHISRIERSRGPVSRYGESAGAVLVFRGAVNAARLGGRRPWSRS